MLPGLVTAWRLASWPTSRSPVLVKATTRRDGPAALGRRDDGRLAALHDGDDGVRRAEVDADDLAHGVLCSFGRARGSVRIGMSVVVSARRVAARRRPRGPAAGPGRAGDSRAGSARRSRPRAARCRARWRWPRARAGRTACPARASIGGHALALEQVAQLAVDGARRPRTTGRRRSIAGRASMAQVEVVGEAQDLADEVLGGEAEVALALLGGPALEVEELGPLALQGEQVLVGLRLARPSRSAVRDSMSASSVVGETSISSARSSARACEWLGIQVIHQLVHQAGHEADRADGLGIAHARRAEHADDADRPAGPAVRRQDERRRRASRAARSRRR